MKQSLITALIATAVLMLAGYSTSCAETGYTATASIPFGSLTVTQPARVVCPQK